ncbi:MAG: citrate synthase [marine benthic group bacterium]|nr:citrate synthase [Gemmatimonadota bacterium]MCL7976604.1 citrate synthase [Gemmatimonadota bacterium]
MSGNNRTSGGLAGVVAAETALSKIDGESGKLWYRGYDIHTLAKGAAFPEVLYLLWYGDLPNRAELIAFEGLLAAERELPSEVMEVLRGLPSDTVPMSALRTAVSALGCVDPDSESNDRGADLAKGVRLVSQMPTVVAAFHRLREGKAPISPDPDLSHSANFLYMLNGDRPGETATRALDTSLILYLEHGLNASTFACRIVASTLSDMHSAITAGIGALKGPLHGGANQRAMEMLLEIEEHGDAEAWVDAALAEGKKIMGFGHRVYRTEDPRATHLRRMSEELSDDAGAARLHALARTVESTMLDRKSIPCNVDFYCATVYGSLGFPLDLYTPLFAIGRVGGWVGHVMEQHENNRLIRPRAEYVGELDRRFVRLEERR